jgi:hypothetical protein
MTSPSPPKLQINMFVHLGGHIVIRYSFINLIVDACACVLLGYIMVSFVLHGFTQTCSAHLYVVGSARPPPLFL